MSYPIIALWSHPRSMSTAFERMMRARGDLQCLHEPFMYDYYIHRSKRQMPHFNAMDDHPRDYESIRDMILAKGESGPVFFKDMAYYVMPHILSDAAFIRRLTHTFLVRHPMASLVSYAKLDPDFTSEELGIEAQAQLFEGIVAASARRPVVVSSERLQSDVRNQMKAYWESIELHDNPDALTWKNETPGDWQQVANWHQEVISSSSIRPLAGDKSREVEVSFAKLVSEHDRFRDILAHHLPSYEALYLEALPLA